MASQEISKKLQTQTYEFQLPLARFEFVAVGGFRSCSRRALELPGIETS